MLEHLAVTVPYRQRVLRPDHKLVRVAAKAVKLEEGLRVFEVMHETGDE